MLLCPPVGLALSVVGLRRDPKKAAAIVGTVLSGLLLLFLAVSVATAFARS
jgi:hypothetical protein